MATIKGQPREKKASVGIVGGGIAGLTAALRLAERGFDVTVYERNNYVGGLLSAHAHDDGEYHEHCFHMFLNWYHNFWRLIGDIGLSREQNFEQRQAVYYLRRRSDEDDNPPPAILRNPNMPANFIANALSGPVPAPDLFLTGYSLLDLVTQQFRPGRLLDQYSVNGFLQSRPYASEQSAKLHDTLLIKAFAVPSYLTSASSYKKLITFGMNEPDPMLWVMRGNSEQTLFVPLKRRLEALGGHIVTSAEVTGIDFQKHRARQAYRVRLKLNPKGAVERECFVVDETVAATFVSSAGSDETPEFVPAHIVPEWMGGEPPFEPAVSHDYVILAVPHAMLHTLIAPESLGAMPVSVDLSRGATPEAAEAMAQEASPSTVFAASLPLVLKLKSEPMAALDVPFKRTLPDIPKEHVILHESTYQLSFIDNSQLWPESDGNTVLNLMASDFKQLGNFSAQDAVDALLEELSNYIAFDWDDIDWARIHFQTNLGDELFINEVGSEAYRPGTLTNFPNLFLAGDFCETPIDVVTVEAAVVSGLQAAEALRAQAVADGGFRGANRQPSPIEIVTPGSLPEAQLALLKVALTPWAYAAKAWSWANEQLGPPSGRHGPIDPTSMYSRMMTAPYEIGATWWRAAWDMWAAAIGVGRGHR